MTQLSQTIAGHLTAILTAGRRLTIAPREERGSVTLENLLWALLVVALVGIATVALTAFINGKVGLLN